MDADGTSTRFTITKAQLIEAVLRLGNLTRRDGEVIVETVFDSVIHAIRLGEKIEIRGFGSFRIRQRQGRQGRNPKTGERVEVPAKRVPYFKPSKELRDIINSRAEHGTSRESASQHKVPPGEPLGSLSV